MHIRFASVLLLSLSTSFNSPPAFAGNSTRDIIFESSIDETTVIILKENSRKGKTLGSCKTPCTLSLKPSKMGTIIFKHPDYEMQKIKRSKYLVKLKLDGPINLSADMGPSMEERQSAAGLQFMKNNAQRLQERLAGPDQLPTLVERVPPFFPPAADRSGWCQVKYDVNTIGRVENFEIIACSEAVFSHPTRKSTLRWQYAPGVLNGKFTARRGMKSYVDFKLVDDDGQPIPPAIPKPVTQ